MFFDKYNGDFSFSNFTSAIRVKSRTQLNPRFLHMYLHRVYLSGLTEGMQSHSTGIRNLNFDAYKCIEIPLPAPDVQLHIVTVLEETLNGIAEAKEQTERKLKLFDELKISVMHQAFTGQL